ncbi:hypothetical protein LIER_12434 [Lithospermum erythrorhizon]|uniref:Uncharacterized protein n=1 Tax=Lithospermum erythrorhizon TaxID=34254 RepID=A0AAV3PRR5_LITER
MLKLRTFNGIWDPSNHLKAYDSQLSFWASEDDVPLKERLVLEPVANVHQLSQLTVKYIKLEEAKKVDEKMNRKKKKNLGRSPRREDGRVRRPQEPVHSSYTPLSTTSGDFKLSHGQNVGGHGDPADIMYLAAYDRLGLPPELDSTVGEAPSTSTIRACFTVVDIYDPSYNGFIEHPIRTTLRAIVSPLHLKMKFPTTRGEGEVLGDQKRARICYQLSIPRGTSLKDPPKQERHREGPPEVMKTDQPEGHVFDNSPRERET